jgi:hypothetical protein
MEDAENSITGVDTMFIGVVNRFAYISTGVTKGIKLGATDPLAKTDSQLAAVTTNMALWLDVYR